MSRSANASTTSSRAQKQQTQAIIYAGDAYFPWRKTLRTIFDNIKFEFFVTGLVIVNMLMLLADMVVSDDQGRCNIYGNTTIIRECIAQAETDPSRIVWTNFFQYLELSFLSVFAIEIFMRLYAYGISYFKDGINLFDASVVIGLLILQVRARRRCR